MNKRIKQKFTVILLLLAIALSQVSFSCIAYADEKSDDELIDITKMTGFPEAPSVSADGIILIEAKSGAILYAKGADTPHYPASITKIMTALVVLENCSLDETVTFSYRATHELESGSSGIARTEGEQMSVKDCLYGMLVASANECAQALAEHVSGSIEAFATKMNERAAELGCEDTHFTNPSGLNNEQHYTTAHDMALIMRAAISIPEFVEIDSTTTYTIPKTNKHNQELNISMTHELLVGSKKYKYAICGKTGYTTLAGFTLVTYAKKDNLDLICVALGCRKAADRADSSIALFDYGFKNFELHSLSDIDPSMTAVSSNESDAFLSSNLLSLRAAEGSSIVLPKGMEVGDLTSKITWNTGSSKDYSVGKIVYYTGNEPVGQAKILISSDEYDPYEFLASDTSGTYVSDSTSSTKTVLIIVGIIFVLIIIGGMFFYRFINGNSKRRRKSGVKVDKSLGIK